MDFYFAGLNVHFVQFPAPQKKAPRIKLRPQTASIESLERFLSVAGLKALAFRRQKSGATDRRVTSAWKMQTFRGFFVQRFTKSIALDVTSQPRIAKHEDARHHDEKNHNRSRPNQPIPSQDREHRSTEHRRPCPQKDGLAAGSLCGMRTSCPQFLLHRSATPPGSRTDWTGSQVAPMTKMWSRFPYPSETGFAAVRLFGALRASATESASPYTIKKKL